MVQAHFASDMSGIKFLSNLFPHTSLLLCCLSALKVMSVSLPGIEPGPSD